MRSRGGVARSPPRLRSRPQTAESVGSAPRSRTYHGDSSVVAQSCAAASGLSSFRNASSAARCTASHGLRAHAAPACDVRKCSKTALEEDRAPAPAVVAPQFKVVVRARHAGDHIADAAPGIEAVVEPSQPGSRGSSDSKPRAARRRRGRVPFDVENAQRSLRASLRSQPN
jgi:hypothetical protein